MLHTHTRTHTEPDRFLLKHKASKVHEIEVDQNAFCAVAADGTKTSLLTRSIRRSASANTNTTITNCGFQGNKLCLSGMDQKNQISLRPNTHGEELIAAMTLGGI